MKNKKIILTLAMFLLIMGCLAPIASAQPKPDSIRTVGKGTVKYNDTTVKALMAIDATFTSGGYSEWGGVAIVAMCFVLPDGTKTMTFTDIPFKIVFTGEGTAEFTLDISSEQQISITLNIIKNKVIGTLNQVITTQNGLELTLDLNFAMGYKDGPDYFELK